MLSPQPANGRAWITEPSQSSPLRRGDPGEARLFPDALCCEPIATVAGSEVYQGRKGWRDELMATIHGNEVYELFGSEMIR